MKKEILFILALLLLTVGGAQASTTGAEWSGTGDSADDPYLISTSEQFKMLATRVNGGNTYTDKFFRLEANIGDVYTYTAIGTAEHPFSGTFDGNGHYIDRPQIQLTSSPYQGIFGYNNGTIKNLKVTDPYILGGDYTGGIVGYNTGIIENCRVDNKGGVLYGENGHNSYGGIAGYNSGTISHCVSATSVDCYSNNPTLTITQAGGIVGHNATGGKVEYCLYLGRFVAGTEYVGAIVGKNEGTLIANLYHHNKYQTYSNDNIGTTVLGVGVSGGSNGADADEAAKAKVVILPEGGTVGQPYGATINGTPTYVTSSNPNGMPLSVYSNGILFRDTYFAYNNNNYSTEIGTAFYTTATTVELVATDVPDGYAATFSTTSEGASISGNTLTVGTDVTEVSVSAQRMPTGWLAEGVRAASFSTTGDNSITITSAAELGLLAYNVNFGGQTYEGYTITIDANEISLADHTWEPIGNVSGGMGGGIVSPGIGSGMVYGGGASAYGFLGTFDGAAKPIKNMNVTGSTYVGLFSNVQSGVTVKNVLLYSPQVKGERYVGAIAGSVSGTIENCHVTYGSVEFVEAAGNNAGMIVYPGGGSIPQVGIGGIAGTLSGGSIKGCTVVETNIYPVVGNAMGVGGIVGGVSEEEEYDYVNETTTYVPATLKDCLFAGNIFKKDENSYVGAIAGMSMGTNTITNNYYVDGSSPLPGVTPNTTLYGIDGADVTVGAERAYVYSTKPDGFGDAITDYGYGMEAYSAGLHYNLNWYSPTAPTTMDITLSSGGDNSTLLSTYSGMTGKVTLDRTFVKDGKWNTICLPFTIDNINATGCPLAGAELWQMTGSDTGFDEESGTLTLNFKNCKDPDDDSDPNNIIPGKSTLIAGRPYLIKWNNTGQTISNLVFEDVTITATSPEDDNIFGENDEITFIGTFTKQTFETENRNILFLGAENKLYFPQPSGEDIPNIGAFRAYFQLNGITAGDRPTEARAFVLNFGNDSGDATRLNDKGKMINDKDADTVWYDLSGRKLNGKPTAKGLYINNGKKVVIK